MSEASKVYLIAVSGGVDSVVLLDALAHNRLAELTNYQLPTTNYQLLIAHFDHGIRVDSGDDAKWVGQRALRYGLEFVSERVVLGKDASEAHARDMRYKFLRQYCKKYNAQLVTAHHQDDVLETMLINLIRGTGWRGLAPMAQTSNPKSQTIIKNQILRPLLGVTKAQIIGYAQRHNLEWREDSTNTDERYLRNYIRHTLLPALQKRDPSATASLLRINKEIKELKQEIATELQKILPTSNQEFPTSFMISRYFFIMVPSLVAREMLYEIMTQLNPNWHPATQTLHRALHFIKSGTVHTAYQPHGQMKMILSKAQVQFQKLP